MSSNILIIEDKLADAELIKYYLEEAAFRHTFFHTESLKDGFSVIRENAIDLVILDLSIRDSIGFKTLTKYLQEASEVPVIVMTGLNNAVVGIQSVKAGAQDFLVKGEFDSRSLVKTIRYSLQRFKMQEKLRQQANQLSIQRLRSQRAHEMARFANWEMDLVNNSMNWSDEMFRIFGFKPNAFMPALSDYLKYVHLDDKENIHKFFEKVIKYGEQQKIEHKIIVDGRQLKRIELTAKVNYDEVSNKILLIGSVQDITDRTGAAPPSAPPTTASSSNNSIRQHAISELSFNIRTPLSSITNLLNLFESTPLNQQQQDLLASLKTSFDDLSVVFNDLLNFSILFAEQVKIQEEDFNLKAFFETYRRSLHIRSEQIKVKSRLLSSDDLPEKVSSDSQKLMLLLNNVFNHAVKYSDEEDTITMEVHSKKSSQKITALFVSVSFKSRKTTRSSLKELMALASDSANDTQGVETIDTKRHVEKVIINKLIRAFGGTFSVLSGNQREIILQIELPVTVAAKEVVTSKVPEPSAPLRLLLVEDHPINRIATKRLLLSWSDQITVDVASNGEECLDKLKTSEYDLILMDIKMPKVSGIEATIKIRKKDSIPIIALTASASKSEEEKCLDVGMNDYLVKPFQPSDLYGCIMKLYQTI